MTGTVIVIGPAEALSTALADEAHSVVVIDIFEPSVDDAMWQALVALQRAHASMLEHGGRIVLVVPTIGMAGAAGLLPYTTAVEGIRAMAKSAARQWRSEGIAVNMVAAPLRLFDPTLDASATHLTAAAFSDDTTFVHSVVESVKFLLRRDIHHLAGETIVADGGSVMLP